MNYGTRYMIRFFNLAPLAAAHKLSKFACSFFWENAWESFENWLLPMEKNWKEKSHCCALPEAKIQHV